MYQSFSVISIEPNFIEKKIIIDTSFDIDEDSVSVNTVSLLNKSTGEDCDLAYNTVRSTIIASIKNELIPNTEYVLKISQIKNVLGTVLPSTARKTFIYKSSVEDIPSIAKPSNYEEIYNGTLAVKIDSKNIEDIFRVEISTDVAFIDIYKTTILSANETNINIDSLGQFYIRARIEKTIEGKTEVGKWSETSTFLYINKDTDDSLDPEFFETIELIDKPSNGVTPNTIMLEFSGNLNPLSQCEIFVVRRDI